MTDHDRAFPRFKARAAALALTSALAACSAVEPPNHEARASASTASASAGRDVSPAQAEVKSKPAPPSACLPGARAACKCDAHRVGTKTCDMRGADWSDCRCAADAPDIKPTILGGELSREFAATGLLLATRSLCTATLVAPDTILTAAHCLNTVLPSEAWFAIGIDNQNAVRTVQLADITVHPQFDLDTLATNGHDLAVAHLSEPIDEVAPVVLYFGDANALAGKRARLTGYGAEGIDPSTLMGFGVGVRRSASVTLGEIEPETLDYPIRGMGQCSGDSGGPLFFKFGDDTYAQVGVVSWSDQYCSQFAGVQRIDIYREWLASVGVPVSDVVRGVSCDEDQTCDGQCEVDPDCLRILCPQGSCTAPQGRCVADAHCDDACGSADPDCNVDDPEQDPCQAYGLNDNGVCNPQCPHDLDCAAREGVDTPGCTITTVMPGSDGLCYYMSDQDVVCDSSPLQTREYDPGSKRCLYFDASGTSCGDAEAFASIDERGQCVYLDPSGEECGRRWPSCGAAACSCN